MMSNLRISISMQWVITWFILTLIFGLNGGCTKGADFPIISQADLVNRLDAENTPVIIDVRSSKEFASGHVPGAVNIPYTEIKGRLEKLNIEQNEEIVLYCERGGRASMAGAILREEGFSAVQHLEGHMDRWRSNKLPCEDC